MRKKSFLLSLVIVVLASSISFCQTKPEASISENGIVPATRSTYELSVEGVISPYQIRINDIPIVTSSVNGPMTFFINTAITKSGKQTITTVASGTNDNTKITVKAIRRLINGESQKDTIVYSGGSAGTFYANVPYEVEDLTSYPYLNNKEMIAAGQEYFDKLEGLLKEHKGEIFMQHIRPALQNGATANYLQSDEMKKHYSSWAAFINKGEFTVSDLKDAKIEVVGDGKMLHIVHQNMEGGLLVKTPKNQEVYIDVYIAVPHGKKDMQPILINFKQLTKDFR